MSREALPSSASVRMYCCCDDVSRVVPDGVPLGVETDLYGSLIKKPLFVVPVGFVVVGVVFVLAGGLSKKSAMDLRMSDCFCMGLFF